MKKVMHLDSVTKNSTGIITMDPIEKESTNESRELKIDTHWVSHLNVEKLPPMLRKFLSMFKSNGMKDMLLVSILTVVSAAIPNLFFRHGRGVRKKYFPNLLSIIEAEAAAGKGSVTDLAIDLIRGIRPSIPKEISDEEDDESITKNESNSLLLPDNATFPALLKKVQQNDGKGLLFASEIDALINGWSGNKQCDASLVLRSSFENEEISYSRKKEEINILCSRIGALLCGTFDAVRDFNPSPVNGTGSRLLVYVNRDKADVDSDDVFDPRVFLPQKDEKSNSRSLSYWKKALKDTYEALDAFAYPIEFCLSEKQGKVLGAFFKSQVREYNSLGGNFFGSYIKRAAVITVRIALILSYIRVVGSTNKLNEIKKERKLYCSNDDFQNTLILAGLIIQHNADYFMQCGGDKVSSMPPSRAELSRKSILSILPQGEFSRREANECAKRHNYSQATVGRVLEASIKNEEIERVRQGWYRKIG